MKEIVGVYLETDERTKECVALCDSEETAMEYAKHVKNWFRPESLYDEIKKNHKYKDLYIKKRTIFTMDDIKNMK